MPRRKIVYSILALLFLLNVILVWIIFSDSQKLKINFLDVGQGDAILISQGANQILIDGGPSGQALEEKLGRSIPFWDRKIETIIITHPDQDHIAGLPNVLENYQIGVMIKSRAESQSQIAKRVAEIIKEKKIENFVAEKNTVLKLKEAQLEIIWSSDENQSDSNAGSVVTKLGFGKNSWLLTGDLPSSEENKLLNDAKIKSQVLKVAHHGSKNSTSQEFLDKVNPEIAIISVGKNNRYGHPNEEVLEKLKNKNIKILRTDERGDIQYVCKNLKESCQLVAN